MAHPSPEAMIQERLTVSLVQLIVEARAHMRDASRNGEDVKTWRTVCHWLEAKLPEGITVMDLADPVQSGNANACLREADQGGA